MSNLNSSRRFKFDFSKLSEAGLTIAASGMENGRKGRFGGFDERLLRSAVSMIASALVYKGAYKGDGVSTAPFPDQLKR